MKILFSYLISIISALLPFIILFILFKFFGKKVLVIFTTIGLLGVGLILFMIFGSSIGYKAIDKQKSNQYHTKNESVYFVRMGNFFELGAVKIEGADPTTFQVLSEDYAKDSSRVYVRGEVIGEADPNTFTLLSERYGRDNRHVFLSHIILEGADPETFEILQNGFSKDKDQVFYGETAMVGVDVASFTYLWGYYASDARNVYSGYEVVNSRNSTPARIPGDIGEALINIDGSIYGKESGKEKVSVLDIADPNTFSIFPEYTSYAKDSRYVYKDLRKIPNSDPQSFQLIDGPFAKDKNQTYYYGSIIVDTDPSIYAQYNLDNNLYYLFYPNEYSVMIVPRSDVRELNRGYLTYNGRVFMYLREIKGVAMDSFQVLEEPYSRDQYNVYHRDRKIANVDMATFKILNEDFSVDKDTVYFEHYILKDVSPDDFVYKEGMFGRSIDDIYAELKVRDSQ